MELSTNIGYLRKKRGTSELRDMITCAKIVKEAGFHYVDFSGNYYIMNDDWRETTNKILDDFEKVGITVDQTHAPYTNLPYGSAGMDEDVYKEHMRRAFELSHMANAKHIVIHADKYTPDENGFDFNKALNTVYDFYAPYVEYAKKVGLGVAIENLFDNWNGPRTRFTSFVEEQKAIIDKFNDPIVTACWDFGHGKVAYRAKHLDAMKQLGGLITCTHVHDNLNCGPDLHQNCFLGDCDWESVMAYLKEIGYAGTFTFEMVYGVLPDALLSKYMKLFYETGEYLINL